MEAAKGNPDRRNWQIKTRVLDSAACDSDHCIVLIHIPSKRWIYREIVPLSAIMIGTEEAEIWENELCELLYPFGVPVNKKMMFSGHILMMAELEAELRDGGQFTMEFEIDYVSSTYDHGKADSMCLEDCPICLENMADNMKPFEMPCKHAFCIRCIFTWLRNNSKTCPICRCPAQIEDGI